MWHSSNLLLRAGRATVDQYLLIAGVDECGFTGGWNARTDELMDDSCIDPEADAVDHYTFSSN